MEVKWLILMTLEIWRRKRYNDDDENKEEELLPDRATANGEIFGELQECVKQRLQVLEYKIQN